MFKNTGSASSSASSFQQVTHKQSHILVTFTIFLIDFKSIMKLSRAVKHRSNNRKSKPGDLDVQNFYGIESIFFYVYYRCTKGSWIWKMGKPFMIVRLWRSLSGIVISIYRYIDISLTFSHFDTKIICRDQEVPGGEDHLPDRSGRLYPALCGSMARHYAQVREG